MSTAIKVGLIDAKNKTATLAHVASMEHAKQAVGLGADTDHGIVYPGIGIIVDGHGLYKDPRDQHYFSIGRRMYAGSAVLFAFDEAGNNIDLTKLGVVMFYDDYKKAEADMRAGTIERPTVTINGSVIWKWPAPRPW